LRTAFTRHNWHQAKYGEAANRRQTHSPDDDSQPNALFMRNHTQEIHDGLDTEYDYKLTLEGQSTNSLTQKVDEVNKLRESE
jgi:hypothetical protein